VSTRSGNGPLSRRAFIDSGSPTPTSREVETTWRSVPFIGRPLTHFDREPHDVGFWYL